MRRLIFSFWTWIHVKHAASGQMVSKKMHVLKSITPNWKNDEDWLVTDVGSFQNLGASARVFRIENGNFYIVNRYGKRSSQLSRCSEREYLVQNAYYGHKNYSDFQITVTTISDHTGDELQLGSVEYFRGTEHSVSPHKNPCTGKAFIPTAPSTKKAILERSKVAKGLLPYYTKFSRHVILAILRFAYFAILRKFCILTYFSFTFLSETHYFFVSVI